MMIQRVVECKNKIVDLVKAFKAGLLPEISGERRWFSPVVEFLFLTFQGFKKKRMRLHAASLTLFSMMALVPVLALALSLARAFGGADLAKKQLNESVNEWIEQMEHPLPLGSVKSAQRGEKTEVEPGMIPNKTGAPLPEEASRAIASQLRQMTNKLMDQIDHIGFGTLGGVGAVMLLWMVISMLGLVETSFNEVWHVETPRTLFRKITDYLCVIVILPFLVLATSTVPIVSAITHFMDQTVGSEAAGSLKAFLESGFSRTSVLLFLSSLAFTFLLMFIPNTRVRFLPAMTGGCVTAVLFGIWLKLCAMLQIGIARYSALYGGFAVFPILLAWVYMSWQIILLGAEIAHVTGNREACRAEYRGLSASFRSRFILALAFCTELTRRACTEESGRLAVADFSQKYSLPPVLLSEIVRELEQGGILAEIARVPGTYLLERSGDRLTAGDIFRVLLDCGGRGQTVPTHVGERLALSANGALDEPLSPLFSRSLVELALDPPGDQEAVTLS